MSAPDYKTRSETYGEGTTRTTPVTGYVMDTEQCANRSSPKPDGGVDSVRHTAEARGSDGGKYLEVLSPSTPRSDSGSGSG